MKMNRGDAETGGRYIALALRRERPAFARRRRRPQPLRMRGNVVKELKFERPGARLTRSNLETTEQKEQIKFVTHAIPRCG